MDLLMLDVDIFSDDDDDFLTEEIERRPYVLCFVHLVFFYAVDWILEHKSLGPHNQLVRLDPFIRRVLAFTGNVKS